MQQILALSRCAVIVRHWFEINLDDASMKHGSRIELRELVPQPRPSSPWDWLRDQVASVGAVSGRPRLAARSCGRPRAQRPGGNGRHYGQAVRASVAVPRPTATSSRAMRGNQFSL